MKKLLEINIFLVIFSTILICFLIFFISNDIVLNDKVYQLYLDEKYEAKYKEYKDLDVDLSEFEDELAQFEQSAEDSSYGWDTFYVDSLYVLVPFLLVVLGFSATYLILVLFNKSLHVIKFIHILKTSIIAFLVFYLPEMISAIYFLVFNKNYELKDIHRLESYFSFSKFFNKDNTPQWFWDIVNETRFVYLLFPLITGLLLSIIYKDLKKPKLIGYSYLAYFIIFVFYNTVFWYLFDLV